MSTTWCFGGNATGFQGGHEDVENQRMIHGAPTQEESRHARREKVVRKDGKKRKSMSEEV